MWNTTDVRDIASFPFDYLGLRGQFKTPSNFQNVSSELQSPENRDQDLSISCAALNGWQCCLSCWLLCLLSKGNTFSEGPWPCWWLLSGWAGGITAAKLRLQPQQPGWQGYAACKCFFCWVQAGRWRREKRARSGEHSFYCFYLLVSLTFNFPFLKGREFTEAWFLVLLWGLVL